MPLSALARPPDFRGVFRTDELALALYSEAAGIARVIPRGVAVPVDADDVAALVKWADSTGTQLVPRGSGSGMAGGAVGAGVIVDLSRLRDIGEVRRASRRISVGAGVTRNVVESRAASAGLRFPVDPSSGRFCTVGGMAATNAAGARTLSFGATRSWVSAIDCVFADGSRATVRRGSPPPREAPPVARFLDEVHHAIVAGGAALDSHGAVRKESSGYAVAGYARSTELIDLLIGSEGTLALFTALELRLAPAPRATSSLLASFDTLDAAVGAAARAREAGAAACELLDRTFLELAASSDSPVRAPSGSEAVLLIEFEGDTASQVADSAKMLRRTFATAGATEVVMALTPSVEEMIWAFRHAASPALAKLDSGLRSMQCIEDGAVPPHRLAEYVRGVRKALDDRSLRGVIFGHAGDGHVHVNVLVDVQQPDWHERLDALVRDVADLIAQLGGTLAGEHGDGRLRTPLLDRVWPAESLELFARVKRCFDPKGILNPGVKIPLEGQLPIGDVKYDPLLPPLPAPARAALDSVERDRAYDRFRLELVERP